MRKLVAITIFVLCSLIVVPSAISAHPIDNLFTDVFVDRDFDGGEFDANTAKIQFQVNWIALSSIFDEGVVTKEYANELAKNDQIITDYFQENVSFKNNGTACTLERQERLLLPDEDILISGVTIILHAYCLDPIEDVEMNVSLFLDDFPKQTNIVNIHKEPDVLYKGGYLTKTNSTMVFSTTGETVEAGRGNDAQNREQTLLKNISSNLEQNSLIAILTILGISIIVGGLHALEGGHSKIILASLLINDKVNLRKGTLFVFVFTLTHLADIFIVGVILIFSNSLGNIYEKLSNLQLFALYAMMFIAGSMVLKELRNLIMYKRRTKKTFQYEKHHHDHDHNHDHSHDHSHDHDHDHTHFEPGNTQSLKEQMTIAFLEGLAPCLTGWAILMLVISSQKLWLVIPVMAAFGVGVFFVLFVFMLLVHRFKKLVYGKVSFLGIVSPLLSAFVLLATAIFFLVTST